MNIKYIYNKRNPQFVHFDKHILFDDDAAGSEQLLFTFVLPSFNVIFQCFCDVFARVEHGGFKLACSWFVLLVSFVST